MHSMVLKSQARALAMTADAKRGEDEQRRYKRAAMWALLAAFLVILAQLGGMVGISFAANEATKESHVRGGGVLASLDGEVVQTAESTVELPLYCAPVLPGKERESLKSAPPSPSPPCPACPSENPDHPPPLRSDAHLVQRPLAPRLPRRRGAHHRERHGAHHLPARRRDGHGDELQEVQQHGRRHRRRLHEARPDTGRAHPQRSRVPAHGARRRQHDPRRPLRGHGELRGVHRRRRPRRRAQGAGDRQPERGGRRDVRGRPSHPQRAHGVRRPPAPPPRPGDIRSRRTGRAHQPGRHPLLGVPGHHHDVEEQRGLPGRRLPVQARR